MLCGWDVVGEAVWVCSAVGGMRLDDCGSEVTYLSVEACDVELAELVKTAVAVGVLVLTAEPGETRPKTVSWMSKFPQEYAS